MPKKLAVARFWFQGNTFCPIATTLDSFSDREWREGEAALAADRGENTELAAVGDFAGEHPDWEVSVLRCASANPAGPIEERVFAQLMGEIVRALAGTRWDAVYLSLHGAAVTTERQNPDLDLVRAVRETIGSSLLGASFDLRANLAPELAGLLDFASGHRTYPHGDWRSTAARVLARLFQAERGEIRPVGFIAHTGLAFPDLNMGTATGPMAELIGQARDLDCASLLDASVFSGFAYADTPQSGASAMVFADGDRPMAEYAARELAREIAARKTALRAALPGPHQALREALRSESGLVAVTDPADSPSSGGMADTPGLLRAALDARPPVPAVFAYFADPEAVAAAARCGCGGIVETALGAKKSRDFGASIPVRARVSRLTDGRYRNRGPLEPGRPVDVGKSALLEVSGIQVIVTERCVPADDPAFFDLHAIDLRQTRLLCVKGGDRFRAAMGPLCARMIDCDAPGPAAADLGALPFRNVRPR